MLEEMISEIADGIVRRKRAEVDSVMVSAPGFLGAGSQEGAPAGYSSMAAHVLQSIAWQFGLHFRAGCLLDLPFL